MNILTVDLIPKTAFWSNVRTNVSRDQWDIIRNKCYVAAGHKCEICGDSGKNQGYNHHVECHEIWDFTMVDGTYTQILTGFIALCPKCHMVKHIGLAQIKGNYDEAFAHLRRVNRWNYDTANKHVEEAFEKWRNLSSIPKWKLDISDITTY